MTSHVPASPSALPAPSGPSAQPASVGVIGLGRMGLPIAGHLVDAGHRVTVYDRDQARTAIATQRGAIAGGSVARTAEHSDILVTVLPGASDFRDVMLGAGGGVSSLRPGSTWLDLTSNDPRVAETVFRASETRGIRAVGAPMGGGVREAERAELEFYVAGPESAQATVAELLQTLAKPEGIHIVGPEIAQGYSMKLLINLLWFGQVAAVTEALLLGEKLGIPPSSFRSVLAGSAGDSSFAQRHLDRLLAGDYIETFGLRECVDELDIVSALAVEHVTPFDVSGTVAALHRDALQRFGAVDGEMLVAKLLRERAGL